MKNVRQLSIRLFCVMGVLALTNCAQKKSDLLSESSAPASAVLIQSIPVVSVNQLTAPVVFNITYANVLNTTLTASDVVLQASGTATCTKSVANVTVTSAQVILTDCHGDGVIRFRIAAGSATDLQGSLIAASAMSSAVMIDNSGVASASFYSLPGAYSAIPSSIDVNFPENVQPSSVSIADFAISGTCSGVTIDTLTVSETVATVALLGTSGCSVGETVVLTLNNSGVVDSVANQGVGTSVATYTVTDTGPTSGVFSPGNSVVMSNLNTFTLTLPGFIDSATVDVNDFVVSGTCLSAQVAAVSMSGSDAIVQMSGVDSCLNAETVIVTTDLSGINDISGNLGQGIISVTYTIDTLVPSIVFSIPGAIMPVIPSSIDVVFSADTNMSTVSNTNFEISGSCSAVLDSVNIVGHTATLNLLGTGLCSAGSTVIVTVSLGGVSDLVGNMSSGSVIETYEQQ